MISLLNKISTVGITFICIFSAIFIAFIVYLCFVPLKTYFTVVFSGCYIPTSKLIGLKARKLDVKEVALLYISARKAKLNISLKEIEMVVQSGGNMQNIIEGLTILKNAGKEIEFSKAVAIELSTKNFLELAKNSVLSSCDAVDNILGTTIDGYEISVNLKISTRANLDNFESKLGKEELKDLLSSRLIDKISSASDHNVLFASPNEALLSDMNLQEISSPTIYSLESVTISNIEIVKDLNMEKEIKSAEKEKIYASIEAERLKNAEEIRFLQTKTNTESMKASVLEAEAQVPRALSEAIKEGRFSVMDYYKLMNLQADTALRRAIIGDNNKDSDDDDSDDGEE